MGKLGFGEIEAVHPCDDRRQYAGREAIIIGQPKNDNSVVKTGRFGWSDERKCVTIEDDDKVIWWCAEKPGDPHFGAVIMTLDVDETEAPAATESEARVAAD